MSGGSLRLVLLGCLLALVLPGGAAAQGDPNACAVGRYSAEYFPNRWLAGDPAVTLCEDGIDRWWWGGGPERVGPDDFSVRWTGRHWFDEGDYTFVADADDGVRVWLDGEPVIDAWRDQATTTYTARRFVRGGEHVVRVEYYENWGEAIARVRWEQASPPADPVIAAAGDIACDPSSDAFNGGWGTWDRCRQRWTSDLLVDSGLAAVLPLGDLQYDDSQRWKYDWSFGPSWGRVKYLMRPAVGNHEYETPGASGYFDYFGDAAGPRDRGYYSFDLGNWHLIALNSNCWAVGGCWAGSPQERWLRADLAAHPTACTLAFAHHPRYSSGQHGDTGEIAPLFRALYDANADVFLSGHDHLYERLAPSNADDRGDPARGIRQFVVGTGGKDHYPVGRVDSDSELRNTDTFGVLRLTLRPWSYSWQFVPEAGGWFTDSGSTGCH